ncbi:nitrous oxide reductase accessory protein NosL [Mesoterricola sediminis]|uniref:Nitrous oxide reductase accessory protein NosL n=1 Tax=Mesoterricola sediminis TaxID=2927980 RepID=A0AA48KCN6_9BACT|nr:nitrous oxide reductase accessory protein NosL [Mesoterricola sediminis]BDU77329.1 nitrous oxide reductase accessory protein NosL [Mesoterricola sediminis]
MRRLAAFVASAVLLADPGPPPVGPKAACPVCGMRVTPHGAWVASLTWQDGSASHFDGAKDLFKFLAAPARYLPGRKREAVAALHVREYYGLKPIRAEAAWYVVGSDTLGPMGHELVPLATEADAREFLRDHGGRRILRFPQVDAAVLAGLDAGRF